jgi:hypothetical protein
MQVERRGRGGERVSERGKEVMLRVGERESDGMGNKGR